MESFRRVEFSARSKAAPEALASAQVEISNITIRPEDRDSEGRLLAFPNGPISNLSKDNWKLVRTESFKTWFGNSDVRDENGEPALVFHYTNSDMGSFDSFSRGKSARTDVMTGAGHYFTSTNAESEYGRNRISAFLNAKLKEVDYYDILSLQEDRVDAAKRQGYSGLLYSYDGKERRVQHMKHEYRRRIAPRSMSDMIFYSLYKIKSHLLRDDSFGLLGGRHALSEIRRITREVRAARKTTPLNFEEIAVFDSDQIMIIAKETDYTPTVRAKQ